MAANLQFVTLLFVIQDDAIATGRIRPWNWQISLLLAFLLISTLTKCQENIIYFYSI